MAELNPRAFLDELCKRSLISSSAAHRAEMASEQTQTPIEKTLLEFGLVEENLLYSVLSEYLGVPFVDEKELNPSLSQSLALSIDFLRRTEVVPVSEDQNGVMIATCDPRASDVIESVGFYLQTSVRMALAGPATIKAFLPLLDGHTSEAEDGASEHDIDRLNELANDGPIIKLVNDIIGEAAQEGASDIHIETEESGLRVRFRMDGALQTRRRISPSQKNAVVSRLKIMANLNISEKRRPQDGRAHSMVRGRKIDIRISTLPTQYGESIVMRLLDRARVSLDWRSLGFGDARAAQIERISNLPNGIFLVAGPTGSGKTTTLYTALSKLNAEAIKIVTVEDPIEYALDGINQVQVASEIEMSFSRALRAILRQDPDVIMVGEIRDSETAQIAVRAALVGRLVLSTVHTNDAISAVTRLVDLGVEPYLLADTLRGVLSQRLLRTNCRECHGMGCASCEESGFKGRMVVSELLEVNQDVAELIAKGASTLDIQKVAKKAGFRTMYEEVTQLHTDLVGKQEISKALGSIL